MALHRPKGIIDPMLALPHRYKWCKKKGGLLNLLKIACYFPTGEEIWLVFSSIPWGIAGIQLNSHNDEGYRYADLSIVQKNTTYLNKPNKPCRIYEKVGTGTFMLQEFVK